MVAEADKEQQKKASQSSRRKKRLTIIFKKKLFIFNKMNSRIFKCKNGNIKIRHVQKVNYLGSFITRSRIRDTEIRSSIETRKRLNEIKKVKFHQ